MKKREYVTLTLAQCRDLYEDHFSKDLPGDLPYLHAAQAVARDVGEAEFRKLCKAITSR